MAAFRFKSCRLLGGNVWNRELTIIQRRILKGLRRKGRFLKMTKNQHSNIQLETTRKLSLFYGDLSVTRTDRRISYIPFLLNLERRLDVTLVRIRFCQTLPQARQLISHGRVCVNHQVVNRIRWKVSPGDLISWKENDVRTHEKIWRSLYVRFLVEKVIGGSLHRPIRVWRRIKTRWYRNLQTKQQWRQLLQSKFLNELRSSVQKEDRREVKIPQNQVARQVD